MDKIIKGIVGCFFIFLAFNVNANQDFGYISYSSFNSGDDIQAIAAKRFLPKDAIAIDREFIGNFNHDSMVHTVVNGWYMHFKDFAWYITNKTPPKQSWPPSNSIDPLFISFHISTGFKPLVFSKESIEYLKAHGPIGARDYTTLKELQNHGIPSYFSGCLTLTLDNPYTDDLREDVIYAVDVSPRCFAFLKKYSKYKVCRVTHAKVNFTWDNESRLALAEELLNKYAKAKGVITGRLHASMPCLALKTPVLLIRDDDDSRFDGLKELVNTCTTKQLLAGEVDINNLPENPDGYLVIRERLIEIMNDWVQKTQNELQ